MFATKFSIPRNEFRRIKKDARLFQSDLFGVLVNIRENSENPRFGVVISNKVSKLATHRNRVRRSFRDALRRNWKKVDNKYDIVFLIKQGIEKVPVSDIMKRVETFIDKKEYVQDTSRD